MFNSGVARISLVILAVIVTGYALFWMRGILTPLALAMFLLVMVDGMARFLCRRVPGVAERAALPLALLVLVLAFSVTVYVVVANAGGFASQLIDAAPRLNAIIAQVAHAVGVAVPPTLQELINQLNPIAYVGNIANLLQTVGSNATFVLVYLGFLIASRSGFGKKVQALFPEATEREHATQVFVRIRHGVERYLWIQTVTGALIAVLSWAVMAVVGLESAVFWAFLIFVVCYIPVVGGLIAGVLPALFALVQFPTWWQGIALFAGLQTILFVVGNVILPRMQRDSLNIDPVVVLLSLAFWGAIWGVTGMFLSTPLTVMGIIILAQFPGSRWIAVLMSGDGDPEPDDGRPAQPRLLPAAPEAGPDGAGPA